MYFYLLLKSLIDFDIYCNFMEYNTLPLGKTFTHYKGTVLVGKRIFGHLRHLLIL
jgi:hypothetical protein